MYIKGSCVCHGCHQDEVNEVAEADANDSEEEGDPKVKPGDSLEEWDSEETPVRGPLVDPDGADREVNTPPALPPSVCLLHARSM